MLRKILLVLLAILVIIQFFRPARNKTEAAQPHFIGTVHTVPGNVHVILKKPVSIVIPTTPIIPGTAIYSRLDGGWPHMSMTVRRN